MLLTTLGLVCFDEGTIVILGLVLCLVQTVGAAGHSSSHSARNSLGWGHMALPGKGGRAMAGC